MAGTPPVEQPADHHESKAEEENEWEYEYSATETEDFYITLDLTTNALPTPAKAKSKDTGPTQGTTHPSSKPQAQERIQLLDLHTSNPLVHNQSTNQTYSLHWSDAIGTDIILSDCNATVWKQADVRPLRSTAKYSVIAATGSRLVGTPVELVPRAKAGQDTATQGNEDDEAIEAATDSARQQVRIGLSQVQYHRATAANLNAKLTFLDRLNAIKAAKGETDIAAPRAQYSSSAALKRKREASAARTPSRAIAPAPSPKLANALTAAPTNKVASTPNVAPKAKVATTPKATTASGPTPANAYMSIATTPALAPTPIPTTQGKEKGEGKGAGKAKSSQALGPRRRPPAQLHVHVQPQPQQQFQWQPHLQPQVQPQFQPPPQPHPAYPLQPTDMLNAQAIYEAYTRSMAQGSQQSSTHPLPGVLPGVSPGVSPVFQKPRTSNTARPLTWIPSTASSSAAGAAPPAGRDTGQTTVHRATSEQVVSPYMSLAAGQRPTRGPGSRGGRVRVVRGSRGGMGKFSGQVGGGQPQDLPVAGFCANSGAGEAASAGGTSVSAATAEDGTSTAIGGAKGGGVEVQHDRPQVRGVGDEGTTDGVSAAAPRAPPAASSTEEADGVDNEKEAFGTASAVRAALPPETARARSEAVRDRYRMPGDMIDDANENE